MYKEVKRLTSKGQRFSIIAERMGCEGDPDYYPTWHYSIASGNYFYASITCIIEENYMPVDARKKLLDFLSAMGYNQYIAEMQAKLAKEILDEIIKEEKNG